jgi:hypothetical protein
VTYVRHPGIACRPASRLWSSARQHYLHKVVTGNSQPK